MDINRIYRHEVFSVSTIDSLAEAARRMRARNVSSLVVMDEREPVGIITERDLTQAIAVGAKPGSAIVAQYMTDHPITVGPEMGVREAAAEMLALDVRHLPVGVAGEVVGMISLRDLLGVVVDDASL
jgi:signal-transduction protein with cAMP-binding, CBS, and nucleotidyltransferase domain